MTAMDRMLVWLRGALDAAQSAAEAAAADTGSADWEYQSRGQLYAKGPTGFMVATGSQDFLEPERGRFMATHDPTAVLRRIAADRRMLDDLIAEQHDRNLDDGWYSCGALTDPDVEGVCLDETRLGKCDCGRDARVERRARLLAEGYGWTEGE